MDAGAEAEHKAIEGAIQHQIAASEQDLAGRRNSHSRVCRDHGEGDRRASSVAQRAQVPPDKKQRGGALGETDQGRPKGAGSRRLCGSAQWARLEIRRQRAGCRLRRMFVEDESRWLTASPQRAATGVRTRRMLERGHRPRRSGSSCFGPRDLPESAHHAARGSRFFAASPSSPPRLRVFSVLPARSLGQLQTRPSFVASSCFRLRVATIFSCLAPACSLYCPAATLV